MSILILVDMIIFLLSKGNSSIMNLFIAVISMIAKFLRRVHVVQVELLGPCFVHIVFTSCLLKLDRGCKFRIIFMLILS